MGILEKILSPSDIRKLDAGELERLASEIRGVIVDTVSRNGGHLASSLGVVELTLALHKVFDLERDRFVFDVGHQSYAHKIITGRLSKFSTLRQLGGISGFPRLCESPYDAFGTGHSSTSISAALGYAIGRDLNAEDYYVGALIGDASLSSGMAFEALNHAGHARKRMMIILNDNEMSISTNVGALSVYLEKIRVGKAYIKLKEDIEMFLKMIPVFGANVAKFVERMKSSVKYMVVPGMIFEELGIKYLGPVDGHNIEQIVETIQNAKDFAGPVLIHAITKKGKGFSPAEKAPEKYHSAGFFCVESGDSMKPKSNTYTDVFGDTMTKLGSKNSKLVAVSAAMCDGTGLNAFNLKFPDRFFDVGICEQHAVTFAAGLSLTGFIPVVALYSTFSQRAFDQFVHDVALQNLHVVLCLDRAGLAGEDGATHHGAFDISMFRMVPNTIVMAPSNEVELKNALYNAVNRYRGPVVIRYPKSPVENLCTCETLFGDDFNYQDIEPATSDKIYEGTDAVVIGVGRAVNDCKRAAVELRSRHNISVEVIDARFIKPLDLKMAADIGKRFKNIITVEENAISGGFGENLLAALTGLGISEFKFKSIGIPDRFIEHGANAELRGMLELDAAGIVKTVIDMIGKN